MFRHCGACMSKASVRQQKPRTPYQRSPVNMAAVYCQSMHSTEPMRRSYDRILPYAFRRFSLLSARRTLVPTILYYGLSRLPLTHRQRQYILPPSYNPALFTMNTRPPMATVWYIVQVCTKEEEYIPSPC